MRRSDRAPRSCTNARARCGGARRRMTAGAQRWRSASTLRVTAARSTIATQPSANAGRVRPVACTCREEAGPSCEASGSASQARNEVPAHVEGGRNGEAIAQVALNEGHGVESTEKVPLERVPVPLRSTWTTRAKDGVVTLGLQDAYALLAGLGDSVGTKFLGAELSSTKSESWPTRAYAQEIADNS
jgi:hypothetical protein